MENKQLGINGEKEVAKYLKKQKFKILEKNFRSKWGEIDIIAQKDNTIAFVEVKTRKNEYFAISQVVNYTKQNKIIKTAKIYILKNNICDKILRFDIATLILKNKKYIINYIKNAFQGN